jgi:hypothetical protein
MHGTITVDARYRIPDPGLGAIPAARAAAERITVLKPSSVVRIDVGTRVAVKWRIENGPPDPGGWEVRVSIVGCADAMTTMVIHTEPFRAPESGFTWRATKEVVNWMRLTDDSNKADGVNSYYGEANGDLQMPIEVCLYDAAGRRQPLGVVHGVEDEELAMLENCHAAGDPSWIVCGDTTDADGKGRLALVPRKEPAK